MATMNRFARLDSALQRGLDNTFALVFGGRLVPAEIEELLKQEIEDNIYADGERLEAPNVFQVGISRNDLANLAESQRNLPERFADQLTRFVRNQGWGLAGPVIVVLAEETGMRTGQLRVSSYSDPRPHQTSSFEAIETAKRRDAAAPQGTESETMHPSDQHADQFPPTELQQSGWGAPAAAPRPAWGQQDKQAHQEPEVTAGRWREEPAQRQQQASGPTVSLLLQDGSSRTYRVHEGSNILGRSNSADLRLPDTGVSREHAEITWNGSEAVLTDLKSTNGTTVNETPVDNWLLADGDVITMGHSHIEVRIVWPGK